MKNHFKMWNYTREKQLAIYTEIGKKYNLPRQVIEVICNSPFKFAKERMSDDLDTKSIMFAYLFKIKPKKKCLNGQGFVKLKENELGNSTKNV